MRTRSAGLLVLALVLVATVPSAAHAQKKSRDLITRDEVLKSAQVNDNLYVAIKALRPNFLEAPRGVRSLGGSGMGELAIYVDRIRQPGLDALYAMQANTIEEVRYLDPTRSQNEYGITANAGAIVVKLYKGEKADSAKKPQ